MSAAYLGIWIALAIDKQGICIQHLQLRRHEAWKIPRCTPDQHGNTEPEDLVEIS